MMHGKQLVLPISNSMLYNIGLKLMLQSQEFPLLPRNLQEEEEEEAIVEIEEEEKEAVVEKAEELQEPTINKHHHLHLHPQIYYRMATQIIGHPHLLKKLSASMPTMVDHAVHTAGYVVMVLQPAATNVKMSKMAKIGISILKEVCYFPRRLTPTGT